MKRKIFSVLLALVLVCSFSLVTAVPVAASPGSYSTNEGAAGSYPVTFTDPPLSWNPLEVDVSYADGQATFVVTPPVAFNPEAWPNDNFALVFDANNDGTADFQVGYNTQEPGDTWLENPTEHWFKKTCTGSWSGYQPIPGDWNVSEAGDLSKFTASIPVSYLGGPGSNYKFVLRVIKYVHESEWQAEFPPPHEFDASGLGWSTHAFIDTQFPVDGVGNWVSSAGYQLETVPRPAAVWVDDDYSDVGGNDGHIWGWDAFAVIQNGINAVAEDGTVTVAAGEYNEAPRIGKALTVKSTDGAEQTTIDGTAQYTVIISHSDVIFDGFTVTNPDYAGGADATGILIQTTNEDVSNVQILDNIVTQVRSETGTSSTFGSCGINVGYAKTKGNTLSNIVISGNTITDIKNPEGGASDHTCGINIWDGADDVVISNNTISDIKYNGIILEHASDVLIENNPIITGCETGIRVEPYEGVTVSNVTINSNNFADNLIQVFDGAFEVLDIEAVLSDNDFDRAVTVDSLGFFLLHTIWSSIQDGIDAAVDDDTVIVAAGTYSENITIYKSLILEGANHGVNAVTETRGSESIIDGGTSTAVTISADDVIVDGFTLDEGITLDDLADPISGGTISNNVITGADSSVEPIKAQNGIRVGWDDGSALGDGLGVDGVTIENNTIIGSDEKGIRFANTEEHKGGPPQHISNITISGNEIKDNGSAGIETYGPGPNTIIKNIISGNDGNGLNLKFGSGDIVTGNIITNNTGPGITLRQATDTTVENNSVSGHLSEEVIGTCPTVIGGKGSGIHIFDTSENNTIRFNDISGNNYGIFIHSKGDSQPSGNFITYNDIAGNINYGILNALVDPPAPVDATNNWWGSINGPTHAGNTYTVSAGDPQGNAVSDEVDFASWLDGPYDTGVSFAPVENIDTEEQFSSIQAAIDDDDTDAGDTINVAAGIYNEAILIDKQLTLEGANVGIPGVGARRDESIIKPDDTTPPHDGNRRVAVKVQQVDGVTIDGFVINGTAGTVHYGIYPFNSNNTVVKNNVIHDIGCYGDNSAGVGIIVYSGGQGISGTLIEGNTVYNTGRMGIGVTAWGPAGWRVCSDIVITNNTVHDAWQGPTEDHGGGVQINVAKNCSITNNEVNNVQLGQRGIYMFGSAAGNTIEHNTLRNNPIGIQLWISGEGADPITWEGETATSPQVHYNNIYDNSEGAISTNKEGTPMVMDATNNWWWGTTTDAEVAAMVSANVAYDPWHLKQIGDLTANNPTESSFDLSWTTTGAWDGDYFDVRYSTSAITAENWSKARKVTGEPTPFTTVNTRQGMRVHRLSENTTYHFGLKLTDKGIGSSDISNIVFATTRTTAPTDTIPPSAIDDLGAATGTPPTKKVILSWTAKGDDKTVGIASRYIIKQSTSEITAANFDSAPTVHNNLRCKSNGESESFTVRRLTPNTTYYFAIKIQDEVPNTSDISNVVSIITANLLPTVTNISPTTGDNGGVTILTITGTNFTSSGTTVVRLISDDNTFHLPNVTYVRATQLTAVVPIGAPTGTYKARVINNNGRSAPSSATYIVTAALTPPPVVTNLIPQMAASSTAVIGVKIFGKNFTGAIAVKFGDTTATIFTVISDTKITADVPGLSAGEYDVKVTTLDGTNSISAVKFKVSAPVVVNTDTTEDTTTSEVIDLGDLGDTNEIPIQITLTTDTSETATQDTDTDAEIEVTIPPQTKVTCEGEAYTGNIHPPRVVKPDESELTDLADNAVVIEMGNPEKTINFNQDFVATIIITSDTEPVIWYYNKDTQAYELAGKTGTKDGIDYVPGGTKLNQADNTYTMGLLLDHMSAYVAGVTPHITSAPATATADVAFTITGTNFHPTAANVYFGGTAGTIVSCSTTQIVVTFPAAGSYTLKVGNPDELSDTASIEITSPPPSPPAGGGGGGDGYEPPPPQGTTDVSGKVTSAGRFTRSVTATSEDELCTLTIPTGTVGLTEELERLTEITILEMDDPPPPPEDARIVGLAYDFGPDGATFDPPITLEYTYDPADIPEGVVEGLFIAYYDEAAGEWVELEGCVVDAESKTITAPVSHFTTFAIVVSIPPPAPAAFSVTNLLVIKPLEIQPKEAVAITVSVANIGGTEGSYTVVLKINGVKEAAKRVTVAAGRSQSVSFSVSKEAAGIYNIAVDGLSASFTVVAPAPVIAPAPPAPAPPAPAPLPPAPPAPAPPEVIPPTAINWPVIGGIIATTVILALLIFFLIRRRKAY